MPQIQFQFVAGWGQNIGDGSPIWALMARARELGVACTPRTCGEDLRKCLRRLAARQLADGINAQARTRVAFLVYSYGMAALIKALDEMAKAGEAVPLIDWLIIIAGVNRVLDGQHWEDCWRLPVNVQAAVAFNTDDSVLPRCCPIRNPRDVYRNFVCNWTGVDHTSIVELPMVRAAVEVVVQKMLKPESETA